MPASLGSVATRKGEYVLLELELPGTERQPAGVLLWDSDESRLEAKLRRDWDEIAAPEDAAVLAGWADQISRQAAEQGPAEFLRWAEDTLSNTLQLSERRAVLLGNFSSVLHTLYQRHVPVPVRQYDTHLPLYSCRAAAGRFSENMQVEEEGWMEGPAGMKLREGMFVAQVAGRSMEPRIPDGSLCIFRAPVVGSRHGRLVLVENLDESDEGGERYTVKRYDRPPGARRIVMQPLNPEFESWTIDEDLAEAGRIRVIAEFVDILN